VKHLRDLIAGERVHVYRNLHKAFWSVRSGGKVIAQLSRIQLIECTCHVSEAARQIVLDTRCRSVHAYIKGRILDHPILTTTHSTPTVVYRPYARGCFFNPATNDPIKDAHSLLFAENGKVYIADSCATAQKGQPKIAKLTAHAQHLPRAEEGAHSIRT
jgi:hypothetical protein